MIVEFVLRRVLGNHFILNEMGHIIAPNDYLNPLIGLAFSGALSISTSWCHEDSTPFTNSYILPLWRSTSPVTILFISGSVLRITMSPRLNFNEIDLLIGFVLVAGGGHDPPATAYETVELAIYSIPLLLLACEP